MLAKSIIYFAYLLKASTQYKKSKRFFYNLLENSNSPYKSYFDIFMICLVALSMFLLVYGVEHTLNKYNEFFEDLVVIIFISEYLLRLWLYSDLHLIVIKDYERTQCLNTPF